MTVFTKGPWFINDSEQQSLLSNGGNIPLVRYKHNSGVDAVKL